MKYIKKSAFPDPRIQNEYGIIALGASPTPELLLDAYSHGIFPWPHPEIDDLPWFSPDERALLFYSELKGRDRIIRYIKSNNFEFRFNTNFKNIMLECAKPINRSIDSSWITNEMIKGYTKLHSLGYAHSIEVYQSEALVGGLYGVSIGKMFAAESMFYRVSNASKCALVVLMQYLHNFDVTWIDCQQLTKHLESLGGRDVHKDYFLSLLNESLKCDNMPFPTGKLDITNLMK